MTDRSSAPGSVPNRTPLKVEVIIERLRRTRMTSTAIAANLGMAVSTVVAVLARVGLNRLSRLEPLQPPNRYARRHAGELIHVDIKTLGRFTKPGKRALGQGPGRRSAGAGWEAVHVAVDDATRLASSEVHDDETAATAVGFWTRAIAFYAAHGITIARVMSDIQTQWRPSESAPVRSAGAGSEGPVPAGRGLMSEWSALRLVAC